MRLKHPLAINKYWLIAVLCMCVTTTCIAEIKPHPTAIKSNAFANALVKLSDYLIKQQPVISRQSYGGYGGITSDLKFYKQTRNIDKNTEQLISNVRWETKHPENLHSVDVYVYDDQGRLIRDYSASYLPVNRRAPFQTLINLHYYHDDLHSTRQYDALDNILSEDCIGTYNNKRVRFGFDYEDIPDTLDDIEDKELRQAYRACFKDVPTTAAPYTDPLVEMLTEE